MKAIYFLLIFVVVLARSFAVPQRPNVLTNEDFERRSLASVDPASHANRSDSTCGTQIPQTKRSKRNAYNSDVFEWPNGRVPYTVDALFDANQKAIIARAIGEYHTKTCVRFVDRQSSDVDYVQIIRNDKVCGSSTYCRQGGGQVSMIGSACLNVGIEVVTHELGHSLCFSHETDRSDRDDYISFDFSKCQGYTVPFPKNTASNSTNLDLLYDYVSVQQYEPPFVSGCISPKLPGVTKFGSGGGLSVLDAEKVNAYYHCGGCYSYRFRPLSLITKDDILVPGGSDTSGAILYPCRGYFNGDIQVGKTIPSSNTCWVPYGGVERQLTGKIEVLTNPKNANLNWIKRPADGSVPANAIPGGRRANRETLYIGRYTKVFNGKSTTLIGTVVNKFCYVTYGGVEYNSSDFDILVCN